MATNTFDQNTLVIIENNGSSDHAFSYDIDFGDYTRGVITRQEDNNKWIVIKGETPPTIQFRDGVNTFILEFDKEVILTESAVKQLVKNIKAADSSIENTISTSNTQLNNKINNLISIQSSSSSSNGNYIVSIGQDSNSGQITITTDATTQDYTNTNMESEKPTSNKAITEAIGTLDYSDNSTGTSTSYISSITQTNGKISPTKTSFTKPSIFIPSNTDSLTLKITTDGGQSDALSFSNASNGNFGVVKIGENISVTNGTISISKASKNTLGVVKIGDNIRNNDGVISIDINNFTIGLSTWWCKVTSENSNLAVDVLNSESNAQKKIGNKIYSRLYTRTALLNYLNFNKNVPIEEDITTETQLIVSSNPFKQENYPVFYFNNNNNNNDRQTIKSGDKIRFSIEGNDKKPQFFNSTTNEKYDLYISVIDTTYISGDNMPYLKNNAGTYYVCRYYLDMNEKIPDDSYVSFSPTNGSEQWINWRDSEFRCEALITDKTTNPSPENNNPQKHFYFVASEYPEKAIKGTYTIFPKNTTST